MLAAKMFFISGHGEWAPPTAPVTYGSGAAYGRPKPKPLIPKDLKEALVGWLQTKKEED